MEQLLEAYRKSTEHIIPRLARFHIEFEGIHPFIDGNGCTGRLLVNLELMKAGYPPIDIKFTDRVAYYNAFDEYHVNHNLNAMETMIYAYFKIGRMIVEEEQHGANRAAYRTQLLKELSVYFTEQFGKGYSAENLKLMHITNIDE